MSEETELKVDVPPELLEKFREYAKKCKCERDQMKNAIILEQINRWD